MASKLILLTYATDVFRANAEGLRDSALLAGFDDGVVLGPDHVEGTSFYFQNYDILSQKRGGGYWLWKPYIIKQMLEAAAADDVILYCDAGRTPYYHFARRPVRLELAVFSNESGFLLGAAAPHLGTLRQWVKRDCLVLMDADCEAFLQRPLIMTWSLWRPTPQAFTFLDRWLHFCRDARCLTDMPNVLGLPNHQGFRDHRHDQAIGSILAYKHDAPFLDFSRTWVQRAIELRPGSSLAQNFYKKPCNVDAMLGGATPLVLAREFMRIRRAEKFQQTEPPRTT